MTFQPDYRHFEAVMQNRRPERLPLYEHIVCQGPMDKILGEPFGPLRQQNPAEYFRRVCRFFREMTYDVVSFEAGIIGSLPDNGAINGGRPGPVQCRADFERFPWDDIPRRYWEKNGRLFEALAAVMPPGMKAVGGVGNGVFEISEDVVGLEYLPLMQVDDPQLYADVYRRIGWLMETIWQEVLRRHGDLFVACRFGDDLGFKSSLLTNPSTVREQILPQYRRVIGTIRGAGKPFLWHSCGCIFEVMDDVIALGINAKHSNEDAIAPFSRWIKDYGSRIGLLGGFDMDFLCQKSAAEVREAVVRLGAEYRATARGYALGSGNSIPDYVPLENYLAMVRGAQEIRAREGRE
jgi:uroporphyrinogen decarboxylase